MKTFNHLNIEFPQLERITIDGVRYYQVKQTNEIKNFVSVTSVTSHYSKEKFLAWRRKVGEEKANQITKAATNRGTHMHTLVEHYLENKELPKSAPLPQMLFNVAKPELNKIDNIVGIEQTLYSEYFELAGTADCIGNYDGKLSIIDFKTSEKPKPREWIDGYFVQAVAYAAMLYELTGMKVEQLVIIMACENGEVETYIETDISKYLKLLVKYIRKYVEDHNNE
jgi:CRISPR/Cas system-associated exonuclease Cas4 (RecB family)